MSRTATPRVAIRDYPYSIQIPSGGYADYLSIADHADFDFGSGDFYMEFFGLVGMDTSGSTMICKMNGVNAGGFEFVISGGNLYFNRDSTHTSIFRSCPNAYNKNPHRFAVRRSGNVFSLFMDGIQLGTNATDANAVASVSGIVRIGSEKPYNDSIKGYIAEAVFIKGYAPTDQEIADRHFLGKVITTGLVCWIKPSEGSGTTTADLSGHGHTATLTGSAAWTTDSPMKALSNAPMQQNLFLWNKDFTQSPTWAATSCTPAAQTITDTIDGAPTGHFMTQRSNKPIPEGEICCLWASVKAGTKGYLVLSPSGGGKQVSFNIATKVASILAGTIIETGNMVDPEDHTYTIFYVVFRYTASATDNRFYISSTGALSYQGDGTGTLLFNGTGILRANHPGKKTNTTSAAVDTGMIRSIAPTAQNLFISSDPDNAALYPINIGISCAPYSWPASVPLMNATSFVDNTIDRAAYKLYLDIKKGITYTLSFFIHMDDGGIPVGGGTTSAEDFICIFQTSQAAGPLNYEPKGNGVYRASINITARNLPGVYVGVIKYMTNSARGFKISGMNLEEANNRGPYVPTTSIPINAGNRRNLA